MSQRVDVVVEAVRIEGTDISAALSADGLIVGIHQEGGSLNMVAALERATTLDRWAELLSDAFHQGEDPNTALQRLFAEYGCAASTLTLNAYPLGPEVNE